MEQLEIEGSAKTPDIKLNAEAGNIEIKGRSIPENSVAFYKPVIDWLSEYENNSPDQTTVNIQLEYFNTSSSKCILDLLKKLEGINNGKSNVHINWHYEEDDEDMLEAGEDYEAILNLPFKMIEIKEG